MVTNLTARGVASAKPLGAPYYLTDISRLSLRVACDGSKSWSLRYQAGKHQRRLSFGAYPTLSLAQARARAREALRQVADGQDPAEAKQARRTADSVEDFAKIYIDEWAKPKKRTWKGDRRQLDRQVLPLWRFRLMRDITRRDVRELIAGIAKRAPIVANRTQALLSKFFNVAIEHDVIEHNPATGVRRPGVEQQRDRVLSRDEIRTFWKACDALDPVAAAPWKLRLLSAQRGGEVFSMQWEHVDLKLAWWTIPSTSAKNKLAHRVPLSPSALALLTALHEESSTGFVFAGARGKHQQGASAKTFGIENFRGHDLRRSAASLMAGSGVPRLVISKILNHVETSVTAIYDRYSYDNEKRTALDQWSRTLTAIIEEKDDKTNILPFAVQA